MLVIARYPCRWWFMDHDTPWFLYLQNWVVLWINVSKDTIRGVYEEYVGIVLHPYWLVLIFGCHGSNSLSFSSTSVFGHHLISRYYHDPSSKLSGQIWKDIDLMPVELGWVSLPSSQDQPSLSVQVGQYDWLLKQIGRCAPSHSTPENGSIVSSEMAWARFHAIHHAISLLQTSCLINTQQPTI